MEIAQAGRRAVVANPNVGMLYNGGTPYRRRLIDPRGDRCTFVALDEAHLRSVVAAVDPRWDGGAPFRHARGPVPAGARLQLHHLLARLPDADDLEVEEVLLELVAAVVGGAVHGGDPVPRTPTERRHRDAVHRMETAVSQGFRGPLSLDDVAAAAGLSPFHAARLFRRHTGSTVHAYREQLRLRAALQALRRRDVPLDVLALELGFTHHSHFTARFRRAFGVPPSAVQRVRAGS
ncbi:MAG: helix-turn-helix transcriptional regulator [Myxococcota bacterium]